MKNKEPVITRCELLLEANNNWFFQKYLIVFLKQQNKFNQKNKTITNFNKPLNDYELTDIVEREIDNAVKQITFNREAMDFLKENYIYDYTQAIEFGARNCTQIYEYYFKIKTIEAFNTVIKFIKLSKTHD